MSYYITFTGPTHWHRSSTKGWLLLTGSVDPDDAREAATVILGRTGWEIYGTSMYGINTAERAGEDRPRPDGELGRIWASSAHAGFTPGPTGPFADSLPGVLTCMYCRCLVAETIDDRRVHRDRCTA